MSKRTRARSAFASSAPVLVLSLLLLSCSREKSIAFDESEPLALRPGVEWALVSEPYAAFRFSPGFESGVQAHARRGDVLLVQGKALVRDDATARTFTWYSFESGWLESSALVVYDNKLKALSASQELSP